MLIINQEFYFENKHFEDEQKVQLDKPFSPEDNTKAIKSLKNNKSCGNNSILNEVLKCAVSKILNIFCKLVNVVFDSGTFLLNRLKESFVPFTKIKVVQEILTFIETLPFSVVLVNFLLLLLTTD